MCATIKHRSIAAIGDGCITACAYACGARTFLHATMQPDQNFYKWIKKYVERYCMDWIMYLCINRKTLQTPFDIRSLAAKRCAIKMKLWNYIQFNCRAMITGSLWHIAMRRSAVKSIGPVISIESSFQHHHSHVTHTQWKNSNNTLCCTISTLIRIFHAHFISFKLYVRRGIFAARTILNLIADVRLDASLVLCEYWHCEQSSVSLHRRTAMLTMTIDDDSSSLLSSSLTALFTLFIIILFSFCWCLASNAIESF